jgi:hypothetical protein
MDAEQAAQLILKNRRIRAQGRDLILAHRIAASELQEAILKARESINEKKKLERILDDVLSRNHRTPEDSGNTLND